MLQWMANAALAGEASVSHWTDFESDTTSYMRSTTLPVRDGEAILEPGCPSVKVTRKTVPQRLLAVSTGVSRGLTTYGDQFSPKELGSED